MIRIYQIFFLLFFLLSIEDLKGQTLTLQSPTSDYTIGLADTAALRSVVVDIHKPSGKIIYVWNDVDSVGTTRDVYCAVYNKDMTSNVTRFRVNHNGGNEQQYATLLINQEDSTFVVVWGSKHNGTDYDVYAKKINLGTLTNANSSNVKTAGELRINNVTAGDQHVPALTFDYFKKELIVGFRDYGGNNGVGSGQDVLARRINYSTFTAVNNQFLINLTVTGQQYLAGLEISPVTGELITVMYYNPGDFDVYKRVFNYNRLTDNYDGGAEVRVNTNFTINDQAAVQKPVINEKTGEYIISWHDNANDGSGYGCYSKIYSINHQTVVADFQISNITTNNQYYPKTVWDEETNTITYFYNYSLTGFSTLRYRMFTYNGSTVTAVSNEQSALGFPVTERNLYNPSGNFWPVYNPEKIHKTYLSYDRFKFTSTTLSIGLARVFVYNNTLLNPVLDYPSYSELKTELDGGYYTTINNLLYFKYVEKYNQGAGTSLNYKIYDYKRNVLSTPALTKVYGVNFYNINMAGVGSLNTSNENYYTLEVLNDKGDKKVLRFKYIPEY